MTWRVLVIGAILGLSVMFFIGLGKDPREIPSPLVGKNAPTFAGVMPSGEAFNSESLKGKVYLVSFWATWCTTCKADEPQIAELGRAFKDQADFKIVGIATQDTLDNVKEYLARGGRPYANLFDDKGKLAIDFGVYGVPETYLVDRQGKIVEKMVGPIDPPKLHRRVKELLAATAAPGKAG
jgi:cytochrome c biogenesis protein CcmG/thiol:disulfide interchange protein DsbE